MSRMYQLSDGQRIYAKMTDRRRIRCVICNRKFTSSNRKEEGREIFYTGICPVCGTVSGERWWREDGTE